MGLFEGSPLKGWLSSCCFPAPPSWQESCSWSFKARPGVAEDRKLSINSPPRPAVWTNRNQLCTPPFCRGARPYCGWAEPRGGLADGSARRRVRARAAAGGRGRAGGTRAAPRPRTPRPRPGTARPSDPRVPRVGVGNRGPVWGGGVRPRGAPGGRLEPDRGDFRWLSAYLSHPDPRPSNPPAAVGMARRLGPGGRGTRWREPGPDGDWRWTRSPPAAPGPRSLAGGGPSPSGLEAPPGGGGR